MYLNKPNKPTPTMAHPVHTQDSPGGVVETETGVADCGPVEVGTATVEEEREGWEGMK